MDQAKTGEAGTATRREAAARAGVETEAVVTVRWREAVATARWREAEARVEGAMVAAGLEEAATAVVEKVVEATAEAGWVEAGWAEVVMAAAG